MYVIYTGNPFDGCYLTGPFPNFQDASEYIDAHHIAHYEIVQLQNPEE